MNDSPETPALQIDMLLLPAFNSAACNAFIDPLRVANYLLGSTHYRWRFLSLDGDSVSASNGMRVSVDGAFDNRQPCDWLVVNASWAPERFRQRRFQQRLRGAERTGATLVGIDTGAFVLAFAGMLDGKLACVHPEHSQAFKELFPNVLLREQLFTRDGSRVCCSGGTAGTDLGLDLVASRNGTELANTVARYLFHHNARPADTPHKAIAVDIQDESIPSRLRDATLLMSRNLEEPLQMADVAHYVGCSQRQLERLFQWHTGCTPVQFYLQLRLQRAHALLTQTQRSIADVASDCGFARGDVFSRAYRKQFKVAPRDDRRLGRVPFEFRD